MNSSRSISWWRIASVMRVVTVLALGVALAACGGNGIAGPGPTPSPSPAESTTTPSASKTSPIPTTTVPLASPTKIPKTTKPKPSASATGGSSGKLDLTCARRGVDTQGITITTAPGGPAGFNTIYSDGSSNVDGKSDYKTGYGASFTDSTGVYRSTWIPPANAPTGPAIVRVVTQDGYFDLIYTVAAQNGSCS